MAKWYEIDAEDEEPDEVETAARERVGRDWQGLRLSMVNLSSVSMLLDVAREQVIEFGPALGEDEAPPTRFVYAQLRQAENLWAAGRADENGNIGVEGFSYVPRPLDKTIKAIIRPIDGKPDAY